MNGGAGFGAIREGDVFRANPHDDLAFVGRGRLTSHIGDGQVQRSGLSPQTVVAPTDLDIEEIHRRIPHESGDEQRLGTVVQIGRRIERLEDTSGHHCDPIGHGHCLDLVMGHVDRRDPHIGLETFDLPPHIVSRSQASRFDSGSSKSRICGSFTSARPSDTPLLLAPGQLAWLSIHEVTDAHHVCNSMDPPMPPAIAAIDDAGRHCLFSSVKHVLPRERTGGDRSREAVNLVLAPTKFRQQIRAEVRRTGFGVLRNTPAPAVQLGRRPQTGDDVVEFRVIGEPIGHVGDDARRRVASPASGPM